MQKWGERRYYSLDYYIREAYGEKMYKLSLDGGMTCPNRDGTLGNNGCIFCSAGGSGDFASASSLSVAEQIEAAKQMVQAKYSGHSFIAYFQAYTNTYAPVSHLEDIFLQAISHPDIKIISIATRPDCLGSEVLDLLRRLNEMKPVWIELGLQTKHQETADFIRRGYDLSVFEIAVNSLRAIGIPVIVHTILGLPGENHTNMLDTVSYLNQKDIQGIKFQLLHILKNTDLAEYYSKTPFWIPTLDEYNDLLGDCVALLRPDIVIHRLTGDGPKPLLIAPLWTGDKRRVLNSITKHLKSLDIWQGKRYTKN